jgi:pilus assembly protein CpaE
VAAAVLLTQEVGVSMLEDVYIAVFTQNVPLYEKLAVVLKDTGANVDQFPYGERQDAIDRWAGDRNLVVVLDANKAPEQCLKWVKQLSENREHTVAVWMEREFNQEHSLSAIRTGARDLLIGEFDADSVRSMARRAADAFTKRRVASTVLGVMGSAGGCGVSTLVANLAVEIAKIRAVPVGVLDLNPCVSSIALLLNLSPTATLFDLWSHSEGAMDSTLIRQAVAEHASGVCLISSEGWPSEQLPIPEKAVQQVVRGMQQLFPYILVDLPLGLYPATRAVLDATEALLLVTPYSMIGATGAARLMQALDSIHYPSHGMLWVANAVSEPAGITFKQICRVLPSKPVAAIPFAPEPVNQATGEGACLADAAPRAGITKSIRTLAEMLCKSFGQPEAEQKSTVAMKAAP